MPVFGADHRHIGAAELGDSISRYLARAGAATGVAYALALDKDVAQRVERPYDTKNDKLLGTDLFFEYSTPDVKQIIHGLAFDPRGISAQLFKFSGHEILIKNFALNNFSGIPTVVVSTVTDLTDEFLAARHGALLKAGVLFLLVAVVGSFAVVKFRHIRAGLEEAIYGARRALESKTAFCEAVQPKLRDVDPIKRGFIGALASTVNESLRAITGHLQTVTVSVDATLHAKTVPYPAN